ncbi:Late histone H2A.1, partial [Acanthisitta chloris]
RMSGHGKKQTVTGKPSKDKEATGKSRRRKSAKAGLQFPVGRVHRFLRRRKYGDRISAGAAVYLAAVLEYMTAEILEAAGDAAHQNKKTRISPRHIQLAVRSDEELNKVFARVIIPQGGVIPNIQTQLIPEKSSRNV